MHREFYIFYELSKLRYYEESRGNVLFVKCIVKKTGRKVHKCDFTRFHGNHCRSFFLRWFWGDIVQMPKLRGKLFFIEIKKHLTAFPKEPLLFLKIGLWKATEIETLCCWWNELSFWSLRFLELRIILRFSSRVPQITIFCENFLFTKSRLVLVLTNYSCHIDVLQLIVW